MYSVVCILKDNRGNTVGAKITDGASVKEVTTAQLRGSNLKFNNAILDRSGFLRAKSGNLKVELVKTELTLYHGSKFGIHGRININVCQETCDFGKGFYLGTSELQAINRVCNDSDSILYKFSLDISSCKLYTFNDAVLWALFVGLNRHKFPINVENMLRIKFKFLDSFDVICGLIADDNLSLVYSTFLENHLSVEGLVKALSFCNYGNQYVIKKQEFCSSKYLRLEDKRKLTKEDKKSSLDWGKGIKSGINSELDTILDEYAHAGVFIKEVLANVKI